MKIREIMSSVMPEGKTMGVQVVKDGHNLPPPRLNRVNLSALPVPASLPIIEFLLGQVIRKMIGNLFYV